MLHYAQKNHISYIFYFDGFFFRRRRRTGFVAKQQWDGFDDGHISTLQFFLFFCQKKKKIFTLLHALGTSWERYDVPIGHHKNFEVQIEAVIGGDWKSFIAIDDLQFVNCGYGDAEEVTCHSDEFRCKDKKSCLKFRYLCDDSVKVRKGKASK